MKPNLLSLYFLDDFPANLQWRNLIFLKKSHLPQDCSQGFCKYIQGSCLNWKKASCSAKEKMVPLRGSDPHGSQLREQTLLCVGNTKQKQKNEQNKNAPSSVGNQFCARLHFNLHLFQDRLLFQGARIAQLCIAAWVRFCQSYQNNNST